MVARRVSLRTGTFVMSLLVLTALGLAGCGGSSPGGGRTASASLSPARAPARSVAHRAKRHAGAVRSPAAVTLGRALTSALHRAGPGATATGAVYDLSTHDWLFRYRASVGTEPASVEKLYTTTAVLRLLGPGATLQTQVFGDGHLDADGVWHGNLYLKGGGDPTFGNAAFNDSYLHGDGSTAAALAGQVAHAGIHRITGHVIADESLFDTLRGGLLTDYKPDTPDFGGQLSALTYNHGSAVKLSQSPAVFADDQFVSSLNGLHVKARAAKKTSVTPVDAQLIGTVRSPPMSTMLRLMDVPSDDLIAEMLTKQLGVRYGGGEGSISAGADVISETIANDYGIHPRIEDGSGLSKGDRSSPDEIVTLLRDLWQTSTGRVLVASLPVVGKTGTVQTIALKTAAVGNCAAKTGTLSTATNLAGYCRARGGDMIAFAFFVQGPPNSVAIPLISDMVAAVARY